MPPLAGDPRGFKDACCVALNPGFEQIRSGETSGSGFDHLVETLPAFPWKPSRVAHPSWKLSTGARPVARS